MLELRFLRGKISPVVDVLHALTCVCWVLLTCSVGRIMLQAS